jgi:hypothetical protein
VGPIIDAFSRAMPNLNGCPNRPPVGATSMESEATKGLRAPSGPCNSLIQKERLVSSVQSIIGATDRRLVSFNNKCLSNVSMLRFVSHEFCRQDRQPILYQGARIHEPTHPLSGIGTAPFATRSTRRFRRALVTRPFRSANHRSNLFCWHSHPRRELLSDSKWLMIRSDPKFFRTNAGKRVIFQVVGYM